MLFMAQLKNSDSSSESPSVLTLGTFPHLSGESLSKKKYTFPNDLSAERTLFLIAFESNQQETLDTWSRGLDLLNSPIEWFETPVIRTSLSIGSFIIDGGMRIGIPNPKIRDRVITLYTDREAFAKSMGFEFDPLGAYVAVVDRSGKNLGTMKGEFDETKAESILSLLRAQ